VPRDDVLVRAAQRGDLAAFEILVRRYSPDLYRLAVRLVGQPATAEDVLQEVWLAAWRFLPEFAGRSTLRTWLHRLTVNAASRAARAPAARGVPAEQQLLDDLAAPAGSAEAVGQDLARGRAVRRAVLSLPVDLRVVVVLYHFEGLGYEETATVLQVGVSTVRGRLYRGRQQLAVALEAWR
jgi:RNA polymerase sigma-70 factor, ECF subfamily